MFHFEFAFSIGGSENIGGVLAIPVSSIAQDSLPYQREGVEVLVAWK